MLFLIDSSNSFVHICSVSVFVLVSNEKYPPQIQPNYPQVIHKLSGIEACGENPKKPHVE